MKLISKLQNVAANEVNEKVVNALNNVATNEVNRFCINFCLLLAQSHSMCCKLVDLVHETIVLCNCFSFHHCLFSARSLFFVQAG
jgi:hypothetical protein